MKPQTETAIHRAVFDGVEAIGGTTREAYELADRAIQAARRSEGAAPVTRAPYMKRKCDHCSMMLATQNRERHMKARHPGISNGQPTHLANVRTN